MSKRGQKLRYTEEEMLEAIRGSWGIMSHVAERLGCHRQTVSKYVKRFPALKEALTEERAKLVDFAEAQLVKKLTGGDWSAIKFVLVTLGRERGYGYNLELSGPGGGPLQVAHVELTESERAAAIAAISERVSAETD